MMMKRTRRLVLSASALGLAIATPVAFSPKTVLAANNACAQSGTCCSSPDRCIVNGKDIDPGYWYTGGLICPGE
jgi:hypothetical protein